MKRVITIVLIAALAGIVAPATSASGPSEKRVAALERQVTLLKKEVKVLKAQVRVLRDTVDSMQGSAQNEITLEKNRDLCVAVVIADLLQSTWTNIDQRVAWTPAFGAQQEIWDPSCSLFGVTRPGISDHPTVDIFGALTAAFIG